MNTLTIDNFDFLLIIALIIIQIGVGIFFSRKGKGSEAQALGPQPHGRSLTGVDPLAKDA